MCSIPIKATWSTKVRFLQMYSARWVSRGMVKPKLLRAELIRFHATPEDFGHPLTAETFDLFFTVSVRDIVNFISDFK